MNIVEWDEYPTPSLSGTGYAGTLPAEPENDVIARLHEAVRDVTGKPVEAPERARMGFLP